MVKIFYNEVQVSMQGGVCKTGKDVSDVNMFIAENEEVLGVDKEGESNNFYLLGVPIRM